MPKRDGLKENKRGRLGHDEMDYIRANAHRKPAAEIGAALGRSEEVVAKYIRDSVPPPKAVTREEAENAERIVVRQELRNSEMWKNLKAEFFPEELKFFEEIYLKMMDQFGEVFATEEMQVFHAVKYEVLMSRNLKHRKQSLEDIVRLEEMLRQLVQKFKGSTSELTDEDKAALLRLNTELTEARGSEKNLTTEYAKLQERHADLMKSLKSTRDQRIKQIDSENKDGFLSVIKALQSRDEDIRAGRQIQLVNLAGTKEYTRLGRPQVYEDGNQDNPILSAETVDLGPEGETDVISSDD